MKRLVILLAIVTAPLSAQVTLRDAVREALAKNPIVTGGEARRDIAEARAREARAMWLPRVSASGTLTRSNNPVFVFGSLLEQGRFGAQHFDPAFLNDPSALTNDRLAVDVRYTLFDQFRRANTNRQARNAVSQSELANDEARQAVRTEAIRRFYGVLLAEQKRDVAAESVRSAEADASAMRDRVEQGLLVESDLLAAEVQVASFRQRLIEAEGELAIARASLATLLQRPVVASIAIAGTLPDRELPAMPIDEAIASGVASRGAVKIAATASANAKLEVDTARGSRLPRADAFASYGASRGDSDHAIGLLVSIDLFDGGRAARNAASRGALEAARIDETSTRDRVTMEIVTAWHRTNAARERIGVAEKSAERAEAAARIVRDRHEHGLTTITEQLRAQTALVTAKLELLAARYDYLIGYAELLRATGALHDIEIFV